MLAAIQLFQIGTSMVSNRGLDLVRMAPIALASIFSKACPVQPEV